MRTTLTLDSDVEKQLQLYREKHGLRLKEAVNELLRKGLNSPNKNETRTARNLPVAHHGSALFEQIDDIAEVLADYDTDKPL